MGDISGLVNCAGTYGPIGRTTTVDLQEFKRTLEVNFGYRVHSVQHICPDDEIPVTQEDSQFFRGGAASPFPNYSAYATSKIALVRYTENTALELQGDSFDVNCVAPGSSLRDAINRRWPPEATRQALLSTKEQGSKWKAGGPARKTR